MDRGQCSEQFARTSPGLDPDMASAGMDSHASLGDSRRYRQRCVPVLLRRSRLDHGTGDLRRWGSVTHDTRGAAGNPVRIAALRTRLSPADLYPRRSSVRIGELVDFREGRNSLYHRLLPRKLWIVPALFIP